MSELKKVEQLRDVLNTVLDQDPEFPVRRLLILLYVYEHGPVSGTEIEEKLKIQRALVWMHLWKLSEEYKGDEGPGFLEIDHRGNDKRTKYATILPAGKRFVERLLKGI